MKTVSEWKEEIFANYRNQTGAHRGLELIAAEMLSALERQEVRRVPGFRMVPVVATREMAAAASSFHEGESFLPFSLWSAMVAAAPDPERIGSTVNDSLTVADAAAREGAENAS